ncbi:MAG: hypothetical protein JWO03_3062 [Bacteroidetes bacterium]|nr:hypothetical protein [Bacteroidota bacterium]
MILEIKKRASNSLKKIADWIDDKNTEGAGDRWLESCHEGLGRLADIKVNFPLCKDPSLARYNYRCFTYKDKWIVAYKIIDDKFIVYRFIYGPWLAYQTTI